jgi:hypothetical protein
VKIRTGFVSNSSSSSFVVAFPEKPINVEHVKQMMFADEKTLKFHTDRYTIPIGIEGKTTHKKLQRQISTKKVAKLVFSDIQKQTENDIENINQAFEKRSIFLKFGDADNNKVNQFITDNKNSYIYTFRYSDIGDTIEKRLACCEIFKNLPHKVISNHICTYIFGENPYEN